MGNSINNSQDGYNLNFIYESNIENLVENVFDEKTLTEENIQHNTFNNEYVEFNSKGNKFDSEDIFNSSPRNISKSDNLGDFLKDSQKTLSISSKITKLTNLDSTKNLIDAGSGVLSISEGIIEIKQIDNGEKEYTSKNIMSAYSKLSDGVGSVLSSANVPEGHFFSFAGNFLKFGVKTGNLREKINEGSPREIVNASVDFTKGAWALTRSTSKAIVTGAEIGYGMTRVSKPTLISIKGEASKLGSLANKIAIPFAIADAGFTLWDLKEIRDQVSEKGNELNIAKENRLNSQYESKIIRRLGQSEEEKKITEEVEDLETKSKLQGTAFGFSALTATALIVAVVCPPAAPIAETVALSGTIAQSLTLTLTDKKIRETLSNGYNGAKGNVLNYLDKGSNYIKKIY